MNLDEITKAKDFQAIKNDKVNHNRVHRWEPFMRKYNVNVICEIGVREGWNFGLLTDHGPKEAVAVDSWIDDGVLARNDGCYTQAVLDAQYETFKEKVKDKPFVNIIRALSTEAVKQVEDDHFDFIYIDADHTTEGCYKDIVDWYPKVKKGGILCGHDYIQHTVRTKRGHLRFGVVDAVRRFSKENNLEYFILRPTVWGVIKQ